MLSDLDDSNVVHPFERHVSNLQGVLQFDRGPSETQIRTVSEIRNDTSPSAWAES